MQAQNSMIQIVIPTCNEIGEIERTMESIYNQSYPRENIYIMIVDFASTDGTYERLLQYDSFHLGIYREEQALSKEYRINEALSFLKYFKNQGRMYYLILFPGDILYHNCLQRYVEVFEQKSANKFQKIICEVDCHFEKEDCFKQIPLYKESFLLKAEQRLEYLKRGFKHKVLCIYAEPLSQGRWEEEYANDWNGFWYRNAYQGTLYLKETLACVNEPRYPNEFERQVKDFSLIKGILRELQGLGEQYCFNEQEENTIYRNYAYKTLWRSGIAMESNHREDAENCWMFAKIFWDGISETKAYQMMSDILQTQDKERLTQFYALLPQEETLEIPEDTPCME